MMKMISIIEVGEIEIETKNKKEDNGKYNFLKLSQFRGKNG